MRNLTGPSSTDMPSRDGPNDPGVIRVSNSDSGPNLTMYDPQPSLGWGRSKLGPRRVYWVVFSSGPEGETIHGSGYEADVAAAERAALAMIHRVDGQHPGRYKVSLRRKSASAARGSGKKHAVEGRQREPKTARVPPREYLYTYDDPSPDEDHGPKPSWNAHPILKKTMKRVWVHPRGLPAEDASTEGASFPPPEPGEAAFVLDREELRREGRASNRRYRHSAFYLRAEANGGRPRDLPVSERTHRALDLLGLTWPCSPEVLKATYRRRSKELHPDAGGDPEEFHRLQAAYEHVSRLV
jgi:hypothetical protein